MSQRTPYSFPKHKTAVQLKNLFVFHLETNNDQEFVEAYGAGLYDVYRLRDRWNHRNLTPKEIEIEIKYVNVFDPLGGNLIMNLLHYISKHYQGSERTYIDKDGDEVVSSYRILILDHSSFGFDSSGLF